MTQSFFDAIMAGDAAAVSSLIDAQPDLVDARDGEGRSAVIVAAYHQEPDIAQLLADKGAHLDVFAAAALGRTARLAELVRAQPLLANAYAGDGFQPLGLASYFGHAETVTLLLACGAEVNSAAANATRVTPLHSAVAGGHLLAAANLLAHRADVNAMQADGFTPLHAAAQNGQKMMVELLMECGADRCARAAGARTAADLARQAGHEDLADIIEEGYPC